MRRAFSLALAFVAVLSGTAWADKDNKLVLWHAYRGKERQAIDEVIRRWNNGARRKNPQVRTLAVPYDALPDKITAAIPRGHGPDVFIYPGQDRIGDWAESKVIEPIEFWMTERHADTFLFKTIDALCYGDSLYGLPMAFKTSALYYNRTLVKKPPTTTAELLALAGKLTDANAGRYGLVYSNTKLYFHAAWLHGFGGQVFDKRGRPHVNTKAAAASLAFARRLGGPDGVVPPECSSTLTTSMFNSGKAAMAISGPWILGELSPSLSYGVALLPVVSATGKRARPFLSVETVMMSARSKRKSAAFALMRFLTSDAMALIRARKARQPVANVAVWKDSGVRADGVLAAFRRQLSWAVPLPGTPQMRLVWSPYDVALQKVIARGEAPGSALAAAEAEINRYLRVHKKSGGKK